MKSLRLALLALLVLGAAPALRAEPVSGLIFAHVKWVETKQSFDEDPPDLFFGWDLAKFRIYDDFIGNIDKKEIDGYIRFHAYPRNSKYRHLYIIGKFNEKGEFIINRWWMVRAEGCISRSDAEYFGILNELAALREQGRIRKSFACDW